MVLSLTELNIGILETKKIIENITYPNRVRQVMMMYTLTVLILFCAFFEAYMCQPGPSKEADLKKLGNYQAKLKSYWTSVDELIRIGRELVRLQEYNEAIPFFSKAIKNKPSDAHYRERGNCYSKMGKWSEAYSDLRTEWVVYLHSGNEAKMDSPEVRRLCSHLINKHQKYNEAILCLTEAIKKDSSEYLSYKDRGDCHKKLKNYGSAELDYREALAKNPKDTQSRISLIRVLFLAGKPEVAAAEMQFLTDVDLGKLGDEFCNREGKFREGVYCYTEASNQSHLDPEYNLKRGTCYEKTNDLEEAINDYSKALQKKPNDDVIAEKLILALFKARRIEDATRVIQGLSNDTLKSLGERFSKAKNFDQAAAMYTEAIERNADDASSFNSRGSCYLAMGNLDLAMSDFERAIKLDPSNTSPVFNWITALFKIGRPAEAVEKLSRLDEPQLQSMGNALLEEGKSTEALECFSEAIRKNPENSYNHEKAGHIYLMKGDFDMAKLETEKAMNLLPQVRGDYRRRDLEINWCEKLVEAHKLPEARFALKNFEVTHGRSGLPVYLSDRIVKMREKMAEMERKMKVPSSSE